MKLPVHVRSVGAGDRDPDPIQLKMDAIDSRLVSIVGPDSDFFQDIRDDDSAERLAAIT